MVPALVSGAVLFIVTLLLLLSQDGFQHEKEEGEKERFPG
jgi:hypothetical protein